jgi:hypothetical protein
MLDKERYIIGLQEQVKLLEDLGNLKDEMIQTQKQEIDELKSFMGDLIELNERAITLLKEVQSKTKL